MKKLRFRTAVVVTVLATVGTASTSLLVDTSSAAAARPATAAQPHAAGCAKYPPGASFQVEASPLKGSGKRNSSVRVTAHAHRGSLGCGGQKVNLYASAFDKPWAPFGTFTTNARGYAYGGVQLRTSMRFKWVWHYGPSQEARSEVGRLIATR
jgi:hypothetical protein